MMHFFKNLLIAAFLLFSSFAFGQQVGVLEGETYYSVNGKINHGDMLQLVDYSSGKIYCCATILKQIPKNDESRVSDILHDRNVFSYSISGAEGAPKNIDGFGIVGSAKIEMHHGTVEVKLDDGIDVSLSTCTSTEGVHYVGRRVKTGKILVHFYNYLDADLDPTCKDLPQ